MLTGCTAVLSASVGGVRPGVGAPVQASAGHTWLPSGTAAADQQGAAVGEGGGRGGKGVRRGGGGQEERLTRVQFLLLHKTSQSTRLKCFLFHPQPFLLLKCFPARGHQENPPPPPSCSTPAHLSSAGQSAHLQLISSSSSSTTAAAAEHCTHTCGPRQAPPPAGPPPAPPGPPPAPPPPAGTPPVPAPLSAARRRQPDDSGSYRSQTHNST